MAKSDCEHNNYPNYLIEKIKISKSSEKELFPHNQEFRLALHEIYFSEDRSKLSELVNTLTDYYFKKENFTDIEKASRKSLTDLENFSKSADEIYCSKNKEIQRFCIDFIKNFYNSKNKRIQGLYNN